MLGTPDQNVPPKGLSSRAWYDAAISEFLSDKPDAIIGRLARNGAFALLPTQRDAWLAQISFLQAQLKALDGSIFLEFTIPRMGRRIDAVLLIGPVVFVVEFKVGQSTFDRAAVDQVWDYALDLKNFHEGSHSASLVPILIATGASESAPLNLIPDQDDVYRPIQVHAKVFREAIDRTLQIISSANLDGQQWTNSSYRPRPTIVEAARTLYAEHSVEAIHRFDAGEINLRKTSRRVEELVDEARDKRRKVICFVTGVPGAGKTLVGLNVATRRRNAKEETHAVFLSGNGPLVAVLSEALARDEFERAKGRGENVRPRRSTYASPFLPKSC